jgi:hypothetical protein
MRFLKPSTVTTTNSSGPPEGTQGTGDGDTGPQNSDNGSKYRPSRR